MEVCISQKKIIIDDPSKGATTRAFARNHFNNCAFSLQIEPKNFKKIEFNEFWILAM